MAIAPHLIQYLKYIQNTGGMANVAAFDEDWEPIGPRLRGDLMPKYIVENGSGKLELTAEGASELAAAR